MNDNFYRRPVDDACERLLAAAIKHFENGETARARLAALDAVKIDSSNCRALELLRRCNPGNSSVKPGKYMVQVEGEAPLLSLHGGKVCFQGNYEVYASSQDEALEYIREIQVVSKSSTLKIINFERLGSGVTGESGGIIIAYPSYSWEIADEKEEPPYVQ